MKGTQILANQSHGKGTEGINLVSRQRELGVKSETTRVTALNLIHLP